MPSSPKAPDGALTLDTIERAVADIAAGKMVIVVDDADRENEGDLIMAAESASSEDVAFMIRHSSGILCAPLEAADARRLGLGPMVSENDAPLATAFTVSVDYRPGLTTGISADERCSTVRALANPNVGAADFVRPGHVFPLVAKEGGVLIRTGHTEAAVDLSRMAGKRPVGLIGELVNDDGTVKKGEDLQRFAAEHRLAMVSIDDLIAYRLTSEQLVNRISEREVETRVGPARAVVYSTPFDSAEHVALVIGDPAAHESALIRIHHENVLGDVFAPDGCGTSQALDRIAAEGGGVFVYLRSGAAGVAPAAALAEPSEEWSQGADSEARRREHWRDIGLGAQIMRDLGLEKVRVLSTKSRQYVGAGGFGVEIVGTELL
ncbi:MAG: 3,4-dihydroxy-2-butanone-4-phosphate synthase [Neomegalonema sp.]|nr:3,4-dihydroxy-2-butanone-4-phosphate synthase [Neomegalonema sp.]